jgi:hypothetical protein
MDASVYSFLLVCGFIFITACMGVCIYVIIRTCIYLVRRGTLSISCSDDMDKNSEVNPLNSSE